MIMQGRAFCKSSGEDMARTFIDISMPLQDGMVHWPTDPAVSIEVAKSPVKGDRSTVSLLRMGSHTGTHVDAPRHFLPGAPGVDAVALEKLIGPCQVVDCRGAASISRAAVKGLDLAAVPRVLFRTDNSDRLKVEGFVRDFAYLEADAAGWLIERGAVLIGVDGLSIDAFDASKSAAHLAILRAGQVILEGLDLSGVAPGRYELICLPLRIQEGDGSPVRAILRMESRG